MALSYTDRLSKDQPSAFTTTATLTCTAFTPAAGALIVALHSEFTSDSAGSVTFDAPAGWGITWTKYQRSTTDSANYYRAAIGVGVVTGTPSLGSPTITRRDGSFSMSQWGHWIEVSGQAASPITESVSAIDSGSGSMALTLAAPPAATSYLFSVFQDDTYDASPTVPSGWTLLSRSNSGDGYRHAGAMKAGSGNQTSTWTTLNNYHNVGVLIVVAEDSTTGQPYIKRVSGGLPFAANRNIGTTVRRF